MEKVTKKQPSVINQGLIMIWTLIGTLGFVIYAFFSFHPFGSWIWVNIVHTHHTYNELLIPSYISIFHLIYWFIVFFGIYIIAFALLVVLPWYLYLKHKKKA